MVSHPALGVKTAVYTASNLATSFCHVNISSLPIWTYQLRALIAYKKQPVVLKGLSTTIQCHDLGQTITRPDKCGRKLSNSIGFKHPEI